MRDHEEDNDDDGQNTDDDAQDGGNHNMIGMDDAIGVSVPVEINQKEDQVASYDDIHLDEENIPMLNEQNDGSNINGPDIPKGGTETCHVVEELQEEINWEDGNDDDPNEAAQEAETMLNVEIHP